MIFDEYGSDRLFEILRGMHERLDAFVRHSCIPRGQAAHPACVAVRGSAELGSGFVRRTPSPPPFRTRLETATLCCARDFPRSGNFDAADPESLCSAQCAVRAREHRGGIGTARIRCRDTDADGSLDPEPVGLLAGDLTGRPIGAGHRLRVGKLMVVNTSRPHWTRTGRARLAAVQIAREVVEAAAGNFGPVISEAAVLLVDSALLLMRRADDLPAIAVERASEKATELLGLGSSVAATTPLARLLSSDATDPFRPWTGRCRRTLEQ